MCEYEVVPFREVVSLIESIDKEIGPWLVKSNVFFQALKMTSIIQWLYLLLIRFSDAKKTFLTILQNWFVFLR